MPWVTCNVKSIFNGFPAVEDWLTDVVKKGLKKTTFDMEAHVKLNIIHADKFEGHGVVTPGGGAIDLGNMLGSVWSSTGEPPKNMKKEAQEQAAALLRRDDGSGFYGYVGVGMKYAGYVESGTKYMPARPFYRPAYVKCRDAFLKYLKTVKYKGKK